MHDGSNKGVCNSHVLTSFLANHLCSTDMLILESERSVHISMCACACKACHRCSLDFMGFLRALLGVVSVSTDLSTRDSDTSIT